MPSTGFAIRKLSPGIWKHSLPDSAKGTENLKLDNNKFPNWRRRLSSRLRKSRSVWYWGASVDIAWFREPLAGSTPAAGFVNDCAASGTRTFGARSQCPSPGSWWETL